MKTTIVYKSLYGSTKQYALWLGKELGCKLIEMDSVSIPELNKYTRLIVMSGTYAGKMPLTDFLKKYWSVLENKELIVVAVGAVQENNLWSRLSYFFIPGKIKKRIKYFKIYGKPPNPSAPPIKKENLKRVLDYVKK